MDCSVESWMQQYHRSKRDLLLLQWKLFHWKPLWEQKVFVCGFFLFLFFFLLLTLVSRHTSRQSPGWIKGITADCTPVIQQAETTAWWENVCSCKQAPSVPTDIQNAHRVDSIQKQHYNVQLGLPTSCLCNKIAYNSILDCWCKPYTMHWNL